MSELEIPLLRKTTTPREGLDFKGMMDRLRTISDDCETFDFKSGIQCVAIANDGKYVLASKDFLEVYDPVSKTVLDKVACANIQNLVLTSDNRCVVSAVEKVVKVWNYPELSEAFTLSGHQNDVTDAVVSHDNKSIISCSKDKTIKIWSIETQELVESLDGGGWIWCVALAKDGNTLFTGSRSIKVWNFKTFECIASLGDYSAGPRSLQVSDDGKKLFVGLRDGTIRVWDLEDSMEIATISGHTGEVAKVRLSSDGAYLLSASTDNTVRIWNLDNYNQEGVFESHTNTITSLTISSDNSYFLSASIDKTIKKWKLKQARQEKVVNQHANWVQSVFLTNDKRYILSSSGKFVKLWDLVSNEPAGEFEHPDAVSSLVLSKDNKFFVTGGKNKIVYIWNLEEKRLETTYEGHTDIVTAVAITSDDRYIVSAGADKVIRVWSKQTSACLMVLEGHSAAILSLQFTPDHAILISCSMDKTIKSWDLSSGNNLFTLEGHSDQITSAAYVPGPEPLIISASFDKTIRIWNFNERRLEDILEGHTEGIKSMLITPDNNYILTGSIDKTIKIWNLTHRRLEITVQGHENWVNSLAVPDDFSFLISGSADRSIRIWNLDGYFLNLSRLNSIRKDEIGLYSPSDFVFRKSQFCKMIFVEGSYQPWMNDIVIGPLGVNALHICCYFNLYENLELALEAGCPIFKSVNGESPLTKSIERNSQKCTDLLLSYLTSLSDNNDKRLHTYISAITSDLPNLLDTGSTVLLNFLNSLFVVVKDRSLPTFAVPLSRLPIYYNSPTVPVLAQNFVHKEGGTGEEKLLQFQTSRFKWNLANGSNSSLELLQAIKNSPNSEIFKSSLISNIINIKWESLWDIVLILTLLFWVLLGCFTFIVFYPGDIIAVVVAFAALNVLFMLYELLQAISQGIEYWKDYWNYLDLMRGTVCLVWVGMHILKYDYTLLTWAVAILCFFRGLTFFRAFKYTRYFVRMIIETAKDSSSFLIILFYSTFAFCVMYASTSNSNTFSEAWQNSYKLDMGEFTFTNDDNLKWTCFHLATLINCILMLNLLIAILSDAFERFQMRASEADLMEMLDLIVELESLMVFRRDTGVSRYLQKCELSQQSSVAIEWEGRTRTIEKKVEAWGKQLVNSMRQNEQETQEILRNAVDNLEMRMNNKLLRVNERIQSIEGKIEKSMNEILQAISSRG
jgi:WD40 repeat protein